MKRKRVTAIILAMTMAVGLFTGCSGSTEPEKSKNAESEKVSSEGEEIHLKFTSWSGGGEQVAMKSAVATFEEQNPNIKVDVEFVDNSNYTAKLNTLMAAGTPPNVAQLNGYLAPEYGKKGELLDLKPYLSDIDMEDVLPEAVFEYDDKIYGITFGVECQMVFYNKELFAQAGIKEPSSDAQNPWTWEEFAEAARKLTTDINGKHPGESGFDSNNISVWGCNAQTWPWFNFTLLNSNGGAYIAPEGDRLLVDEPESKEVLKAIQDIIYVDQSAPKPSVTSAMPSGTQMLMDKQMAMYVSGQYEIASFAEAEYGEFGVAPMPMFKKPASMLWGEPLVVYDSGDERINEAAVKLVLALGDPSVVSDLFVSGAQMPIYKSWYTDPDKVKVWTDNVWHTDQLMSYFNTLFGTTTSREAYYIMNYDPIMAIVQPRLDKIWDGEDVDTALDGIQEEAKTELQGYYKLVDYYSDAK